MANYSTGDIIYVDFPYTEIDQRKRRPCLVVASCDEFVWALMITKSSNLTHQDDYVYELNNGEVLINLPEKSSVRCNIIMTIKKTHISKKFSSITSEAFERIWEIANQYWKSGEPNIK